MTDYAGVEVRSETLLNAGLKYLRDLKKNVVSTLAADNSHTLMRSLEILDLMQCGEVIFMTALERRETRGSHKRPDYPFTNPLMNKMLICRKTGADAVVEWREPKR